MRIRLFIHLSRSTYRSTRSRAYQLLPQLLTHLTPLVTISEIGPVWDHSCAHLFVCLPA